MLFGRRLVWLNCNQLDKEAEFRANLVHVRANAESIAQLHREGRMGVGLRRRLGDVTAKMRRLIAVNRNLAFFTNGYDYLIQTIPALVVAPLFMQGEVEFGVITHCASGHWRMRSRTSRHRAAQGRWTYVRTTLASHTRG